LRQWMVALNMDDAFFPGNSAGIAYGTPEYVMDAGEGMNPTKVLELYYSFKVNDNFTVPVYLDFINNAGNYENGNGTSKNAFGIAVRPTLTF
ncbi:MAG: carbohydrate porin, partial [Cyanobacteria bacterium MAG CAR4_bin_6]|nr:carbohydrate porin [Cyanobacteria bacterium MAG CAR4_bin_6]